MADLDPELIASLKLAKGGKEMFFVYIPKGPLGKLIVSKKKIPPKEIKAAKDEIGGSTPIIGKCCGPYDGMVFKVAKPSAKLGESIKKVAKRDSGLTIKPQIVLSKDAELDEDEIAAAKAKAEASKQGPVAKQVPGLKTTASVGVAANIVPTAPPAVPPVGSATAAETGAAGPAGMTLPTPPPPAAGKENVITGLQKGLQKLGYDPGKIDGVMGPKTSSALKKFQKDNGLTADGVGGPKTQAAMAKALKGGAATPDAPPPPGTPPAPAEPKYATGEDSPPDAGVPKAPPPPGDEDATGSKTPASPPSAVNFGPWTAARDFARKELLTLATAVKKTGHASAVPVIEEINSIISMIKGFPANPAAVQIDKILEEIRKDDLIASAEEAPEEFHKVRIREPLVTALEGLKSAASIA